VIRAIADVLADARLVESQRALIKEQKALIESLTRECDSWRRSNDSWKRTDDLWRAYQRSMVSTVRRLARMLEDYADGVELTEEGRKQLDVFLLGVATAPLEGNPPEAAK
jgi:hypothetical protein